ncbi:MAG: hypothetical protein AMXMBFR83_26280 [Phycisphaerae bacterium]
MGQDPPAAMSVTSNLTLEKNAVLRSPILIEADNVVLDGNGATLEGPGRAGDLKSFAGVGVRARGRSNVTIRNLKVKGFEIGLSASDGRRWLIENCDFSDNYHDPDFGWGEHAPAGGMLLEGMSRFAVRNCKANRVWNGLELRACSQGVVSRCDFSRCSNVCLKMWNSSGNTVDDNNLSYGLRIRPGEVHARDSAGVLIESGSDSNRFNRNDVTHGGDGIFIRVLNGWCSRRNVFIGNDCSHANNNGFESWSPDNTFISNKANHCSFGFWLGGSDHTVLLGNEAAWNGRPDGFHNAPEPDFRHGGIVIVHGSGTHTLIDGNHCHHNNGAGIVFRGDLGSRGEKWKMYHLVVQNNRLEDNEWGLFARFAHWLTLSNNQYRGNGRDEHLEEVTGLTRLEAPVDAFKPPRVNVLGPVFPEVGRPAQYRAFAAEERSPRPLTCRWEVGGTPYTGTPVQHAFDRPGFHRVGVTVDDGRQAGLGFLDVYAVRPGEERATESGADLWDFTMGNNADGRGRVEFINEGPQHAVGLASLHCVVNPYAGADVSFVYPKSRRAGWDLSGRKSLSFWIKFRNPNLPGFQDAGPIVRLHGRAGTVSFTPTYQGRPRNLLNEPPYPEARYGWLYVEVPLAGGRDWQRTSGPAAPTPATTRPAGATGSAAATGPADGSTPPTPADQAPFPHASGGGAVDLKEVDYLSIQLDSWGYEPFDVYLDGLAFE